MTKILVFGNSGSGKSTLARKLCARSNLAHLDLDTLAWKLGNPPERESLENSAWRIQAFLDSQKEWVIEGCYTDLLEIAEPASSEIIFMNLAVDTCVQNAKQRPWEPHKYETADAQNTNLPMLINWIEQYAHRNDTFSFGSHLGFYEQYTGPKRMIVENE